MSLQYLIPILLTTASAKVLKILFSTMLFGERTALAPQNTFSPADLLEYMDSLLRAAKMEQAKRAASSNYSWLRSRSLDSPPDSPELEEFTPIVQRMSSESCTMVAVKFDALTESVTTPSEILTAFKKILEEHYNLNLLEGSVKRAKEKARKSKTNRVHPELSPPGRQPTVSFILEREPFQ